MGISTDQIPSVPLRGGRAIPQLGFGVFQVPPSQTAEVVAQALSVGYRRIDTAAAYRNEATVGEAIGASGLDRGEVFLTTKCWNDDQGFNEAKRALRASLERLRLDYVDLYLIHWPVPSDDRYVETWKAFIDLHAEGLTRAIGVSNFLAPAARQRRDSQVRDTGAHPGELRRLRLRPQRRRDEGDRSARRRPPDRAGPGYVRSPLAERKLTGVPGPSSRVRQSQQMRLPARRAGPAAHRPRRHSGERSPIRRAAWSRV